jgi:hypothetical protein
MNIQILSTLLGSRVPKKVPLEVHKLLDSLRKSFIRIFLVFASKNIIHNIIKG